MLTQIKSSGEYKICQTETIRSQDLVRFSVQKGSSKKPYIVTFQSRTKTGCSCPAGKTQKLCKHVAMVRALFDIRA